MWRGLSTVPYNGAGCGVTSLQCGGVSVLSITMGRAVALLSVTMRRGFSTVRYNGAVCGVTIHYNAAGFQYCPLQ